MTIVEMCVHMDSAGCEKKTRKALLKIKGVDDVEINTVTQKVTVIGTWVDQKKVLKAVRKISGATAVLWPYPHNVEYHGYNHQYNHRYDPSQHVTYGDRQYVCGSTSSYDYSKNGYDDSYMYGHYERQQYSTAGEKAGVMFSDENPNACSIM